MALWGNNDNRTVASSGIVTVSGTTVTGTGTTFTITYTQPNGAANGVGATLTTSWLS